MTALSADTKRALFDELVKLAEQSSVQPGAPQKKSGFGTALKAMGVGAAGLAAGYGLSEGVARLPVFHSVAQRETARKIILPILSGVAGMLAERYRHRMNEQYQQVRGYNG